ncbi:hypothetical protein DC3_12750 [Deinococcus cellulosilyticus NBRC 106333 = KACC 11606]|uniref:Uncharacterized protein n=1 Tax=Deinococcus cellulosilyticus (strain DSM 18568 / NBRC 106333 / KACC 11606 / 5516J-15) TaxID=1223518 RepID=A0A511MYH2_DEIC1|nr:hypothetical protein DC3_12750 [Deinococcus cellulosilyticus NBRC 106333 = KACC 11606]
MVSVVGGEQGVQGIQGDQQKQSGQGELVFLHDASCFEGSMGGWGFAESMVPTIKGLIVGKRDVFCSEGF